MDELRQAFEEAYEESETEEEAQGSKEVEVSSEEAQTPSEELEDNNSDDQSVPEPREEVKAEEGKGEIKEPEEGKPESDRTPSESRGSKAPSSWSPKARESWGKLSSDAQLQITKREKEVNQVLQESAQARNFTTQFSNLISPHRESLIASGASNPLEAVQNLLQAESQLRLGSTQQRAQAAAKMISDYGIDINALDSALSGQPIQQSQDTSSIESLLDQRLAPVNQFLQQQQQLEQQRQIEDRSSAEQSVQEFSQNAEFINDVRSDMADLLDMASARGQTMSLEQAYNKACAINPEISEIMKGRATQQQIMGNNNSIQEKRAAASSITGRQGGAGGKVQSSSLRGQLEDAWSEFSG